MLISFGMMSSSRCIAFSKAADFAKGAATFEEQGHMGGAQHAVRTPRHSGRARGSSAESAAVVLCGMAMGRHRLISLARSASRDLRAPAESRAADTLHAGLSCSLQHCAMRGFRFVHSAHTTKQRGEGRGKGVSGIVGPCLHSFIYRLCDLHRRSRG